jgi:hypothetical protein
VLTLVLHTPHFFGSGEPPEFVAKPCNKARIKNCLFSFSIECYLLALHHHQSFKFQNLISCQDAWAAQSV